MKTNQLLNLCACIGMLALTGCMDHDVYNPEKDPDAPKPASEYFDFATTRNVDFEVNYGVLGGNALIEIFTENPVSYNEHGSFVITKTPVYKIFADKEGRFAGTIELPAAASTVYVFSPTWGAPLCVEAEVENGKVKVDTSEPATRAAVQTRANSTLQPLVEVNASEKIYSLMKISNKHGKPNDYNGLMTDGDLSAKDISNIQKSLWKGSSSKPSGLNNSNLLRGTEYVNTTIAKAYLNEQGETVVVEDAELYFTFLTESGWNQNTVGYYYYKTDECPATADGVDKIVIFPNASIANNNPYHLTGWSNRSKDDYYANAPISTNEKVQLLFKDEDGNLTTKFPAGYTIGYFIIADGFTRNTNITKAISTTKTFLYSNSEWNKEYNGNRSRFISLSTTGGTVVYGVEDSESDTGYEDVLFTIDATPNEAIQNPDRPVIDPETNEVIETDNSFCIFAFEDIWPTGGDYDLNDVIVEFNRSITFNEKNQVTEVKDTYKPVQDPEAASKTSAFAVQYAATQRGTMELPATAVDETQTNSVILFPSAKAAIGQEFTVIRTFEKGAMMKGDLEVGTSALNPFIIVDFPGQGVDNRTEVHLPKHKATNMANPDQIGSGDDAYYVNKNGKHPFAIVIPAAFTPVTEKIGIEKEYPDFEKWVDSNGAEYTDWYKNYQKYVE